MMDPHFDAERLAAFADGSLSRVERESFELHAADCPRCLELLAAMARTGQAPIPAGRWRMPVVLRWAVPLAAGATALALWINIEPRRAVELPQAARDSVATDVLLPTSPPPAAPVSAPAPSAKASPAPSRPSTSPLPGLPPSTPVATPMPPVLQERREQAQTAPLGAATAVPRAEPPAEERARSTAPPASAPRSPEAPQAVDRFDGLSRRMAQVYVAGLEVVSPDPLRRWRVRGAAIERSTDGGRTWVPQPDVSGAQILAGVSPSGDVVWLAGRAGTVLLSSDGKQWQRLPFPEGVPLISVRARSAQDADVTAADGRIFRTTDGGRTWSVQESPLHPF